MSDSGRILVVDDEESIRGILSETLTPLGFEVTEAENAEKALMLAAQMPFDLVMSDIRMPGLSGLQLLRSIKGLSLGPEVIIMTSHASLSTAMEAIRAGAYDYLLKPFEDLDIIAVIARRAIERRRLSGQNEKLIEDMKGKNEELKKATQRAALILAESRTGRNLVEHLLSLRDVGETPDAILRELVRMLHMKSVCLWILDPKTRLLKPAGRLGLDAKQVPAIPLPFAVDAEFHRNAAHWFSKKGHREALEDLARQWGGGPVKDRPIVSGDEGYGLIAYTEPDPNASFHSGESLETFFMIAAFALKNMIVPSTPQPSAPRIQMPSRGFVTKDDKTPFFTFEFFQELLEIEIRRSRRYHHRFTVFLVSLNLTPAMMEKSEGMKVVRALSDQIQGLIRNTDVPSRCGNKFFIVMPETDLSSAIKPKRRLEAALKIFVDGSKDDPVRSGLRWSLLEAEYPGSADTMEGLITGLETKSAQNPTASP
ncbi:MAG TPA: response regulator [Nitrospiria bacterium]